MDKETLEVVSVCVMCVLALVALAICYYLYFFPSILAYHSNHSFKGGILFFNAITIPGTAAIADGFTFWFLVPWLVLLFWSSK